jgi:uncharacterized iron-regulated membrane protein
MELLFGSHIRSGGRRIGYLAGIEVDPASRRATKIVFSKDGKLTSETHTRALSAVTVDGKALNVAAEAPVAVPSGEPLLWSRSTHLDRRGQTAHLAGVVVGSNGEIETLIGRQHWWSKRFRVSGRDVVRSEPGYIFVRAEQARAA